MWWDDDDSASEIGYVKRPAAKTPVGLDTILAPSPGERAASASAMDVLTHPYGTAMAKSKAAMSAAEKAAADVMGSAEGRLSVPDGQGGGPGAAPIGLVGVPESWSSTGGRDVTRGKKLDPEAMRGLFGGMNGPYADPNAYGALFDNPEPYTKGAYARREDARRDFTEGEAAKLRATVQNSKSRQAAIEAARSKYEAQQVVNQARIADRMAANERIMDEIRNTEISASNMYKGKAGVGVGIGHVLAIALGAIGAGMQARGGMQNPANAGLEAVNRAIDRDLQSQMANLKKKEFEYQAGRNMIADLMAKGASEKEAFLMARQLLLERYETKLEELTYGASDKMLRAKGEMLRAGLAIEKYRDQINLKLVQQDTVRISSSGTRSNAGQVQDALKNNAMARAQMAAGGAGKQINAGAQMKIGQMKSQIAQLGTLEREGKKFKQGLAPSLYYWLESKFPGTDANTYDGHRKVLALTLSAAMNQGRPTDKDTEYVLQFIPGPGDKASAYKMKRVKLIAAQALSDLEQTMTSGGFGGGPFRQSVINRLDSLR